MAVDTRCAWTTSGGVGQAPVVGSMMALVAFCASRFV